MSKMVKIIYDPKPGSGFALAGKRPGDEVEVPEKLAVKLIAAGAATKKTVKRTKSKTNDDATAEVAPTVDAEGEAPAEEE